jgi:hypothetical protein
MEFGLIWIIDDFLKGTLIIFGGVLFGIYPSEPQ